MTSNDDEDIEKIIAELAVNIEDCFLSLHENDADAAADLSLYLIAYVFCHLTTPGRAMLYHVITIMSRGCHDVLEDFDDLKNWVDNIILRSFTNNRFLSLLDNEEDREDADREAD